MNEDLLLRVPLFAGLPSDEIQNLAQVLRPCEFPAGAIIFMEGDPGDRFSIIVEGEIEIIKALGTPEERVLSILGPGSFLGDMSVLDQAGLRSASARARLPVSMLEMTDTDFEALMIRQTNLAIRILREMGLRLRNTENATIRDLREKNSQLAQAYQELKAAQAQLIEKEKMEHELRMARRIQERSLPKELPQVPGWEIAAYWQPARAVSGDFYDFITFPDGRLALVIGDVTDKGVPAALVMATTRSVLRAVIDQVISPCEVLCRVNDLLCPDMPPNMFVTCLYALLDPSTGELRFANAGHDLPYQSTDGGVIELRARGMPLGLLPGMEYEEQETRLEPGDNLLLYSDGLVEAHNPQSEMFGFPRLRAYLLNQPGGAGLISFLLDKLAEFTGPGWEQEDDVTFVTLKHSAAQ